MNIMQRPRRMALVIILGMSSSVAFGAGETTELSALDQQAGRLGQQVHQVSGQTNALMPQADIGGSQTGQRFEVAQSSRESAATNVRLGQLEEQLRVLNGQVEGLQFQLTQMQTFLERQQQDYEFRFEQLEGSKSGKTSAAPLAGGAMLSGGVPQKQTDIQPGALPDGQSLNAPVNLEASAVPETAGDLDNARDLNTERFELGTPEQPLGTLDVRELNLTSEVDLSGQPSDLKLLSTDLVTNNDADAQYKAGYEAVVRGDADFAEDQFRQFVDLFPNHAQAPEAANWLGDALIQRGEFDEAADVLLKSFQDYSTSARAPDLLLKLGVALAGAGENDTACRTFGEVQRRFSAQPVSFVNRLKTEMDAARC